MKVYLYKEYQDDLAYGEECIKVYLDRNAAIDQLKKRIKEEFDCEPKDLIGAPAHDDDFVEIARSKGAYEYYVVEEHEVIGTENSMSAERAKDLLRCYVVNDLEAADTDYVREVLCDVCGMSNEELAECGLGDLVVEDESDD